MNLKFYIDRLINESLNKKLNESGYDVNQKVNKKLKVIDNFAHSDKYPHYGFAIYFVDEENNRYIYNSQSFKLFRKIFNGDNTEIFPENNWIDLNFKIIKVEGSNITPGKSVYLIGNLKIK